MDDLCALIGLALDKDPNFSVRSGSATKEIVREESRLILRVSHPLSLLEYSNVPRSVAEKAQTYSHELVVSSEDGSLFIWSFWIGHWNSGVPVDIAKVALDDLNGAGVHHLVVFWTSILLSSC